MVTLSDKHFYQPLLFLNLKLLFNNSTFSLLHLKTCGQSRKKHRNEKYQTKNKVEHEIIGTDYH